MEHFFRAYRFSGQITDCEIAWAQVHYRIAINAGASFLGLIDFQFHGLLIFEPDNCLNYVHLWSEEYRIRMQKSMQKMRKSTTNCSAHDEEEKIRIWKTIIKKRSAATITVITEKDFFFSNQHKPPLEKKRLQWRHRYFILRLVSLNKALAGLFSVNKKNAIQIRFIDVDWNPVASVWTINIEVA